MRSLISMLALALAGCATGAPVDHNELDWPADRYMKRPAALPNTPDGIAMNGVAVRHSAQLRRVCVWRGGQVRGLQAWVRTVAPKKKTVKKRR